MVSADTIKSFKFRDPDSGKEFIVEMKILDRLYLMMYQEIAKSIRRIR